MPVTAPVTGFTVATAVALLPQVPPASYSSMVAPAHKAESPIINAGAGFTVIFVVEKHPVPSVYVIVAVPDVIPVTYPVPAAI